MARSPTTRNTGALSPGGPTQRPVTAELDTSELSALEEHGVVVGRPNVTIALETTDLVELKPGMTRMVQRIEDSIIVEPEPSVVVDLAAQAGTPLQVKRIAPTRPRVRDTGAPITQLPRVGGRVVVVVYVIAIAALGIAIYERFVL